MLLAAAIALAAADPSPALRDYARQHLRVSSFKWAAIDLNGDGQPEQIIYADSPDWCGSGGCTLFVLGPASEGYRLLLRAPICRLPIVALASRHRGWRDMGVGLGGGGVAAGMTRLSFDGTHYVPANPTMAPIVPKGRRWAVLLAP